ncbi:MAG: hypothetical protein ABIL09_11510 [Gemmatimonadota bacterium]
MKRILTLASLCLVVLAQATWSQTVTTQGVLRGSDGKAVEDATYRMEFRLYEEDGSVAWTETHADVPIINGVYSVELNISGLDLDRPYWLSVEVNGEGELAPRTRLAMSPYLFRADGDENVFPSSGNVGIGVETPSVKLHIEGGVDAGLGNGSGFLVLGTEATANLVMDSNEIMARNGGNAAALYLQADGGNVSIGAHAPTPSASLDVYGGAIRARSSGAIPQRPTTGTGVEIEYAGDTDAGIIRSYDRDHAAYKRLRIDTAGLHLREGTDAGLSGGSGFLVLGTEATANLVMDGNEIMARSSGLVSSLLLQADGGEVRVGFRNPGTTKALHVRASTQGSGADPDNHVAVIENTYAGIDGDVLALKVQTAAGSLGSGSNFITFFAGDNYVGEIEGRANGVVYQSTGGDFAEWLPRHEPGAPLVEGDIVGVFEGKVSRRTAGADQLMVVTRRAIVLGNAPPREEERALYEQVAFVGQVPIRVEGTVRAGDCILASGAGDGVGVAVAPGDLTPEQAGRIVGRAWETADGRGVKLVNASVGLDAQAWLPLVQEQQRQLGALAAENARLQAKVDRIEAVEGRMTQLEARYQALMEAPAGGDLAAR